ncbi:MAG: M23 family metallopeptidase [Candidatus Spyradosoma sp.]
MRFAAFFLIFAGAFPPLFAEALVGPTSPGVADFLRRGDFSFLQPAASGRPESAMFGMVRNGGTRFHEGVDVKSVRKMAGGVPMDVVRAVCAGTVAHVSPQNNGSYGRYVVLLHESGGVQLYTLYAHLLAVSPSLKEGARVPAGAVLGMLGRTSTAVRIDKSSAHLHFEVGMMLGEEGFDAWYRRRYGPGNLHGRCNGFNLAGADPLDFFAFHSGGDGLRFREWIASQKKAFSVRLPMPKEPPSLAARSPALKKFGKNEAKFCVVDFTWFGMPLAFRGSDEGGNADVEVFDVDSASAGLAERRGTLSAVAGGHVPGSTLKNYLEIIFDRRFP